MVKSTTVPVVPGRGRSILPTFLPTQHPLLEVVCVGVPAHECPETRVTFLTPD